MEKHSAYCAMTRLWAQGAGDVAHPAPAPARQPALGRDREALLPPFVLDEIAERIGYPLFMKPFDGGAHEPELAPRGYEVSGARFMHLQAAVEDFDVFTRSLSIGPQTAVMRYDPSREWYDRYAPEHGFVSTELEEELVTISRLVNASFRWELNSCEVIAKDGDAHPIDYANASPDRSLVSLQYFFPWAIASLVAWCVYACVTNRRVSLNETTRAYFELSDSDLPDGEKLRA